ncbi:unnamed protein product [Allacma fusca]|uniref:CCHC-type domain-containing protein n=1 Tax=Allacma fusca TaxID=39272 RepID=A0A8J2KH09_9HEXA|nr:unnamed protein product [Allacma fusca]
MEKRFGVQKSTMENQMFSKKQKESEDPIEFMTEVASKGKMVGMSESTICGIVIRGLKREIIEKIGMLDNSTLEKIEGNILKYQNGRELLEGKAENDMVDKIKLLEAEVARLKMKQENDEIVKELSEVMYVQNRSRGNDGKRNDNRDKYCKNCRRKGHHTKDCWYNQGRMLKITLRRSLDLRYFSSKENLKENGMLKFYLHSILLT